MRRQASVVAIQNTHDQQLILLKQQYEDQIDALSHRHQSQMLGWDIDGFCWKQLKNWPQSLTNVMFIFSFFFSFFFPTRRSRRPASVAKLVRNHDDENAKLRDAYEKSNQEHERQLHTMRHAESVTVRFLVLFFTCMSFSLNERRILTFLFFVLFIFFSNSFIYIAGTGHTPGHGAQRARAYADRARSADSGHGAAKVARPFTQS